MQSTTEFVDALNQLYDRAAAARKVALDKCQKHILGWPRVYSQLADLCNHLALQIDEYAGDNPVEERPLTDGERGIYRAAENWWEHIQALIDERNAAVAAASSPQQ